MALIRTAAPVLEPVSLAEAKAHLRLTTADEDGLVLTLIRTAREALELRLSRALIAQGWSLWLDRWPTGHVVPLPIAPVRTIEAIRLYAADGVATPLLDYFLDAVTEPGRLVCTEGGWPMPGRRTNGIEIAFTAGHGDLASEVPSSLKQAVLLLVAELYENREAIAAPPLSPAVIDLIAPYRERRL